MITTPVFVHEVPPGVNSADLRAKAAELFEEMVGTGKLLRPGDELIAEIPTTTAHAPILSVIRPVSSRRPGRGSILMQLAIPGPDGRRFRGGGPVFIPTTALPLLAEAIAKAMDIELRGLREVPAQVGDAGEETSPRPPAPEERGP